MANSFRAAAPPFRRPAASENHADGDDGGDTRPLLLALRDASVRWKGQRNEACAIGQAEIAIDDLMAYHVARNATVTLSAPIASFTHGRFVFEMTHSTLPLAGLRCYPRYAPSHREFMGLARHLTSNLPLPVGLP